MYTLTTTGRARRARKSPGRRYHAMPGGRPKTMRQNGRGGLKSRHETDEAQIDFAFDARDRLAGDLDQLRIAEVSDE